MVSIMAHLSLTTLNQTKFQLRLKKWGKGQETYNPIPTVPEHELDVLLALRDQVRH